ncbi:MAG TPA: DUF3467 domain-containing protein [Anaerolineae bacterium]|nr:DUF3467 domain-containing protein [Anaerolineae bacterium]
MAKPPHPPPSQRQINVELPANLEATYANFAIINHSPSEIIIDFGQLLPNVPKAKINARVLMTPLNAKLLHQALGENLAKYERRFGPVNTGAPEVGPGPGFLGGLRWSVGPGPEEDTPQDQE